MTPRQGGDAMHNSQLEVRELSDEELESVSGGEADGYNDYWNCVADSQEGGWGRYSSMARCVPWAVFPMDW
jgi:bacteriocin-like protein